jgi:putrescine transport system substrate-binding protein
MKIRPYITYFHSSKYMADIANGDICVAVGYSGSFSQAANRAKEAKNGVVVDMRLPKEGAPIWFDMLAIPKGAKNPEDAYTFINYLLQPAGDRAGQRLRRLPEPEQGRHRAGRPGDPQQPQPVPDRCGDGTLYTLQPLPRDAERARTRAWTKIKSGT